MKLFRRRKEAEVERDEGELAPGTGGRVREDLPEAPPGAQAEPTPAAEAVLAAAVGPQAEASPQGDAAEVPPQAPGGEPTSLSELLGQTDAEGETDVEGDERTAEGDAASEGASSSEDDELDPELVDIFRDARNEVQESTLASELDDIPIDELLRDAVGISQHLGISTREAGGGLSGEDSDADPADDYDD